jgi:hypothetical protein
MNKKIKHYSALALATATVIPMACKEEENINSADIIDIAINRVVTGIGSASEFEILDSIDINSDGVFDFALFTNAGTSYENTYAYTQINGLRPNNNILTNNITVLSETFKIPTSKNNGDKINPSSANWTERADVGFAYLGEEIGFAGDGDKYYGFRFSAGDGIHYGWLKVNLTADYRTLTIKELAYHKTPNTEIAVGAK